MNLRDMLYLSYPCFTCSAVYGRPFKTLCLLNYALMIRHDYDLTSSLRRGALQLESCLSSISNSYTQKGRYSRDDGDDDDGDSSGDDANYKDDDEEEEEEHFALANSVVVIHTNELVSPPEGIDPVTPPPSTDTPTTGARITV
nr:hypothetical protein [Tanacetum cinerariifolium]